jgi:hypothetical protein
MIGKYAPFQWGSGKSVEAARGLEEREERGAKEQKTGRVGEG